MQTMTTAEMRKKMTWCDKLIDKLDGGDARDEAIQEWIGINTQIVINYQKDAEIILQIDGPGKYIKTATIEVFRYSDGLYAYASSANAGNSGYSDWFHGSCRKTRQEAIDQAKRELRRWSEREVSQGNKEAENILKELNKSSQQALF